MKKLKTIEEGLNALRQTINLDKDIGTPHPYIVLLYTEKAKCDPAGQKEYEALAKKENQEYKKKIAESRKRLREKLKNDTFPSTNVPGKKKTGEIEEDGLSDLLFEVGFFGGATPPPPPPPPPPAMRKSSGL